MKKEIIYILEICSGNCEFSDSIFIEFDNIEIANKTSQLLEKSKDILFTEVRKKRYNTINSSKGYKNEVLFTHFRRS